MDVGTSHRHLDNVAKNAVDLEVNYILNSAWRRNSEDIPHTRNNWIYYDF
jgi:hypothetical protein